MHYRDLSDSEFVKAVEHRLQCTCGCTLDIYTCRTTDFTCTYSPELHRELLALRADGSSPEEIVGAFVAKYGEQVLMAHHDTVIEAEDHVILFLTDRRHVEEVGRLFQAGTRA